jgi:hypothetical protein
MGREDAVAGQRLIDAPTSRFAVSRVEPPTSKFSGQLQMTDSAASSLAIFLGIGVFLVIVAVGWRSVQNRRILRLQGANGQETIIVASEDDEVSSVVTTTTTEPSPAEPAPEFGRSAVRDDTPADPPRTTSS